MSFDSSTIKKDITEAKKQNKEHPDFSHLLSDIQRDAKKDQAKLKKDVDAANVELQSQGFPKLTIENGAAKQAKVADSTTTTTQKGSDKTSKPDEKKAEIKRDGDKITEIHYPNGKSAKFSYDDKGNLVGYDNDERCTEVKNGNVAVDKAGNVTTVDDKGNTKVIHPDGTALTTDKESGGTTTENSDGSKIVRRKDGQVSEIDYPNGKTAKFHYDENGKLIGYDNDKECAQVQDGKNVSFDKDGTATYTDAKGNTRVVHPDGSSVATDKESGESTTEKADGSKIVRRKDGNITEIDYPNGKTAKFEYDNKTGALTGYTDQEKRHWTKDDDGAWRQKSEDGKHYVKPDGTETDKKEEAATSAKVSVNKETGDITFEDGKNKKVVHADGKVDEEYEGRRSKIAIKDGKASHEVKKHDTLWAIAEDNFSRMHDGKQASVKEIQAEMDRIVARYNENHKGHEIKNKNRIPIGTEFDLS